jgi:hypothetical protein
MTTEEGFGGKRVTPPQLYSSAAVSQRLCWPMVPNNLPHFDPSSQNTTDDASLQIEVDRNQIMQLYTTGIPSDAPKAQHVKKKRRRGYGLFVESTSRWYMVATCVIIFVISSVADAQSTTPKQLSIGQHPSEMPELEQTYISI